MFARLTFIKTSPEHSDDIKKVFTEEVMPVVRTQQGNVGCWLLEPENENDDYISLTEWRTSNDADLYESTGIYQFLGEKVQRFYQTQPVLKTYNITEIRMSPSSTQ